MVSLSISSKLAGMLLSGALLVAGCLGSILYVSDGNPALKGANYWTSLTNIENSYGDVQAAVKSGHIDAALRGRARELAIIYRQNQKPMLACEILRLLWIEPDAKSISIDDALELAGTYTDLGSFSSAVECYQTIMAQDKQLHGPRSAELVRDYSNLAQCCYLAGAAQAEPTNRKLWLNTAIKYGDIASKLARETVYSDSAKQIGAQQIIDQNTNLARSDLAN